MWFIKQGLNRVHRTIGVKPSDVNSSNAAFLLKNSYSSSGVRRDKQRFKEGDYVRISKRKTIFAKGYTPNWSAEIFKVITVRKTIPYTYLLEDSNKQPIQGVFYAEELQKTKYRNIFLVEKILKRNKNKIYVKWLGFSKPSWITVNDLVN